jgi:hypothetical protein
MAALHEHSKTVTSTKLIPRDAALWRLDWFEDFIEQKKLIYAKFAALLVPRSPTTHVRSMSPSPRAVDRARGLPATGRRTVVSSGAEMCS